MIQLSGIGSITSLSSGELASLRKQYNLRRSDRFTAFSLAAAKEAFRSAGIPEDTGERSATGLVFISMFGPNATTCSFLDDLLTYREEDVLPTTFSHSVHNAAASYLAMIFRITGPLLTLTAFDNLWKEALITCETLLKTGSCREVLLVAAEEHSPLTPAISKEFGFSPPEGALALLLSLEDGKKTWSDLEKLFKLTYFDVLQKMQEGFTDAGK